MPILVARRFYALEAVTLEAVTLEGEEQPEQPSNPRWELTIHGRDGVKVHARFADYGLAGEHLALWRAALTRSRRALALKRTIRKRIIQLSRYSSSTSTILVVTNLAVNLWLLKFCCVSASQLFLNPNFDMFWWLMYIVVYGRVF